MNAPPSLCVVMCTYNGAAYLGDQLASIAAQTRLPDSMVVVDDCSRDATSEILREFSFSAPFPVKVVANAANLGYVKNFEKAIGIAAGDVFVLSDQDDVWKEERLERTEAFFLANPDADALFSDAELVDDKLDPFPYGLWQSIEFDAEEQRMVAAGDAFHVLLRRNVVTGATMAFRATAKDRVLPIPTEWVHDEWIAMMIAATGVIRSIPERLILYRQHGANQIGARKRSMTEKLALLFARREGFHAKLLRKTELLRTQLANGAALRSDLPVLSDLDRKLKHLALRTKLPSARWLRMPAVLSELVRGGYFRYSSGWKSVVRDLFEPF